MKKTIIIILLVVGVLGVGVFFGFKKFNLGTGQIGDKINGGEEETANLPPTEPDPVFAEPLVYGQLKQAYSGTGFSLKYPDGFKVSSNPVENSQEVVTVENDKGSGFQIFILPFDEPGMITPERIWQDMPDMEINDPKVAKLDGVEALVFNGYDDDFGETFEVWAVNKGKLYQMSGPKTATDLISETLNTWDWK